MECTSRNPEPKINVTADSILELKKEMEEAFGAEWKRQRSRRLNSERPELQPFRLDRPHPYSARFVEAFLMRPTSPVRFLDSPDSPRPWHERACIWIEGKVMALAWKCGVGCSIAPSRRIW